MSDQTNTTGQPVAEKAEPLHVLIFASGGNIQEIVSNKPQDVVITLMDEDNPSLHERFKPDLYSTIDIDTWITAFKDCYKKKLEENAKRGYK